MLNLIQNLFSDTSILPELVLFAAKRPSNALLAAIMIPLFIIATICSAFITHKLRNARISSKSENPADDEKNDPGA